MKISSDQVSAKVRDAFDFNVDKFPLSGPDGMSTPLYGLFRDDTSKLVGASSVTKRYVPHQTDDVLALVDAAAEAFDGEIDVKCHFRDGHYVNIMPTRADRLKVFGETDNVFPRIVINAGYDGKAFRATMGYYRDLCRNLAMLRQVEGTTVAIRHTSSLRGKMDDLIATFNTLKESWGSLSETIQHMQNRNVQMADFLVAVYGEPTSQASNTIVKNHKGRTEAIFKRLRDERFRSGRGDIAADFKVSAWEAYNAVQGFAQHDMGFRGRDNNSVSGFERILRASNDQHVRKAESLVLDLAV